MIYPTFKDIKTFYVWGCYKNDQIKEKNIQKQKMKSHRCNACGFLI